MSTLIITLFALSYFFIGYFFIKKEIKAYQIVSTLLFSMALNMIYWNITIFIVYLIAPITFVFLMRVIKKTNVQVIYFSIPCWLVILSVIINLLCK